MITETLVSLFNRDLNRIKTEIEQYKDETKIWITDQNISNSAGNLCLHLLGNLNTFIGAEIGKTGYIRNRPLEFSLKNIPRAKLITDIENLIQIVTNSLLKMAEEDFNKEYPILIFEKPCSYEYILIHLTTHLTYHLGQINYHRRLLDK